MPMLPIGPLMIEHRLIGRVIQVINDLLATIQAEKKEDPAAVEKIIHFIRAYADRCHHGKEEGILFQELGRKSLSPEHKLMIEELVKDHELARKITLSLVEYNTAYQAGQASALGDIALCLRMLIEFYPHHIEKEDKQFFIPVMDYFSQDEKEAMIRAGYEADSRLLHEEYADLVKTLEPEK
jgi:hemerythrin-like domain-containing protein